MGEIREHEPVLFTATLFSRHEGAIVWAREKLQEQLGEIAVESELLPFYQTKYYAKEMGDNLLLQLLAFKKLGAPERLAEIKLRSNDLEREFAASHAYSEQRPLNIDPGYLTLGKFVLATTKDASHRLYLGSGIFGEVTLYFVYGEWKGREWTYPNYLEAPYKDFLAAARNYLRSCLRPKA